VRKLAKLRALEQRVNHDQIGSGLEVMMVLAEPRCTMTLVCEPQEQSQWQAATYKKTRVLQHSKI
jgi:hypothetical protein